MTDDDGWKYENGNENENEMEKGNKVKKDERESDGLEKGTGIFNLTV